VSSYASDHAGAYADLAAAGATVTFSRSSLGQEGIDGTFTGASSSTIEAVAIGKAGNPTTYRELGLTLAQGVTLLVAPADGTLGAYTSAFVLPGDRFTWNGKTFTVREVGPVVAPNGTVIVATVIGSN